LGGIFSSSRIDFRLSEVGNKGKSPWGQDISPGFSQQLPLRFDEIFSGYNSLLSLLIYFFFNRFYLLKSKNS